ncbi:hypothetical protein An11g05040 [Aspergillus niger]|uniref:Uncharacterized protein n=2 Tax=Aspergillus niger TaxID=5061 RepID=A2QWG2_ASPNC|nr:hypothetical protein An11g05040 [Aspergillus niger]CAK48403.1 hypothetical protein An11g05040 [Aspergillus niger]
MTGAIQLRQESNVNSWSTVGAGEVRLSEGYEKREEVETLDEVAYQDELE